MTIVGLDDTDSRERGMCTTYLAARLAEAVVDDGGRVDRKLLIRLNPAVEHKTRGNAALALHTDLDPERALELFAEAGWTREGDGPLMKDGEPFTFTLFTAPIDTWTRSAQIVQGMLAELGIEMEIQTYEFGTLLERYRAAEHQAGFMGYTYTNPDIVHLWFHSSNIGSGLAHSHFPSDELDALIERSRTETDPDTRLEIYAEIQRFISDRALWVPLWTNDNYIAVSAAIDGALVHPDGFLLMNDATLE